MFILQFLQYQITALKTIRCNRCTGGYAKFDRSTSSFSNTISTTYLVVSFARKYRSSGASIQEMTGRRPPRPLMLVGLPLTCTDMTSYKRVRISWGRTVKRRRRGETHVSKDVRGQRLSRSLRTRTHRGVLLAWRPLHRRWVLVGPLGRRWSRATGRTAHSCIINKTIIVITRRRTTLTVYD